MAVSNNSKTKVFWSNAELQNEFLEKVYAADFKLLLQPEMKPAFFGRKFVVAQGKRRLPYPLLKIDDRLFFVEKYLEYYAMHSRDKSLSPYLVYYYLFLFQQKYTLKKSKKSSKRLTPTDKNKLRISKKINAIMRMLDIPLRIRRIKDGSGLIEAILDEMQDLSSQYALLEGENKALLIEAEICRNDRMQRNKTRLSQDQLEDENIELRRSLQEQTHRAQRLEEDFRKMADKILNEDVPDERSLLNELGLLRHEYNLISQKYDALVSQNIDLSNRLDTHSPTMALEDILNSVRDRVNRILRTAVANSDEILLSGLRNEIEQLQRSRIYLGRALYDIGLLYLRSGNKKQAVCELRAARELGVENFETNSIIGVR